MASQQRPADTLASLFGSVTAQNTASSSKDNNKTLYDYGMPGPCNHDNHFANQISKWFDNMIVTMNQNKNERASIYEELKKVPNSQRATYAINQFKENFAKNRLRVGPQAWAQQIKQESIRRFNDKRSNLTQDDLRNMCAWALRIYYEWSFLRMHTKNHSLEKEIQMASAKPIDLEKEVQKLVDAPPTSRRGFLAAAVKGFKKIAGDQSEKGLNTVFMGITAFQAAGNAISDVRKKNSPDKTR